jgi:hypothetical protein
MARKTTTRLQDDVLWNMFSVLYYKEGKTIGIQKYILIVWQSNVIIWNIEAKDKIGSSSC